MAFCEQCGTQLGGGAAFCSGCGKPAKTYAAVPPALPQATFEPARVKAASTPARDFSALPLKWRLRFAAIEKAGGEHLRWWQWPQGTLLTSREKWSIVANPWAFFFGPFYHLYLGMWRKALTLTLVVIVMDLIFAVIAGSLGFSIGNFLPIVAAVMFNRCANVDYYRKTVLKRREWW